LLSISLVSVVCSAFVAQQPQRSVFEIPDTDEDDSQPIAQHTVDAFAPGALYQPPPNVHVTGVATVQPAVRCSAVIVNGCIAATSVAVSSHHLELAVTRVTSQVPKLALRLVRTTSTGSSATGATTDATAAVTKAAATNAAADDDLDGSLSASADADASVKTGGNINFDAVDADTDADADAEVASIPVSAIALCQLWHSSSLAVPMANLNLVFCNMSGNAIAQVKNCIDALLGRHTQLDKETNVIIEFRLKDGETDNCHALASTLVGLNVAVRQYACASDMQFTPPSAMPLPDFLKCKFDNDRDLCTCVLLVFILRCESGCTSSHLCLALYRRLQDSGRIRSRRKFWLFKIECWLRCACCTRRLHKR